jgi:hypothetical protein
VGVPKQPTSANTSSIGFSTKLVTISAITPDGQTAICVDKSGTEVRVPMLIQRAKGALPVAGEQWIVSQDISSAWSFAAIASTTDTPFQPPPPGPPAPGSIPGSAIEPGSLTGNELAIASIGALNLAANAAGTNIIVDPQFSSPGLNAVRLDDAGTTCSWTLQSPAAAVSSSGAAACTLALMPSVLVPLYVNPGEQYYLSVGVMLPGGAPAGISAGIQFAFNDGSFLGPVLPVSGGLHTVAQLVTIPAGVASAYVRLVVAGLPSGVTASLTAPVCYVTVGNTQIQVNSVDASKIVANTIGVAQLQAGLVYAGIVDATVVTGATLQNHSTNPKTSINPDGSISITNASGTVIFKIGPDGTIYWYNSAGFLQMQLSPGGTQAIYQFLTGPAGTDFEPPSAPAVLVSATSAVSSTTYANTCGVNVPTGSVITVIVSAAGATAATGVTDSKGNAYTLVQSGTTGQYQQVFQAVGVTALTTSDTITVTVASANAQQKNIIALATQNVLAVTPLDFSAQAAGTSTAPSVTGTPTAYGDSLLFIGSWANAGTAGTVPDGWQQAAQVHATSQQWTGVWYAPSLTGSAITASAVITSAAWTGVLLGYKAAPAQPLSTAPVPLNATLAPSTLWADDGVFSCRVTKVGTASQWGVTFPPLAVQPGAAMAARIVMGTLNIALGTFEVGFTWWSGPNGTGSNLGTAYVAMGTIGFNAFAAQTIYNCIVPNNAVSATFYAMEKQADTAGNWFLIDNLSIPGGMAYSNSPVVTSDLVGNQIDQGITFVGLPGLTNVLGVRDAYSGAQIAGIDGSGVISGQLLTAATDVGVAGASLTNDILPVFSQGVVARGWAPGGGWPSTPIGTTNTPIVELDQTLSAGRGYRITVIPCNFIPTNAATQYVQQLRATTDGSTPTTSSPVLRQTVVACTNASLNHMTPYTEYIPGNLLTDTLYRLLVTANVQAGTFQYQSSLEIRVEDIGNWTAQQFTNNGVALGTGTGGGAGPQTYTEYFYGNVTWSYNEFGLRNSNGTLYQGAYSGEGFAQHCWIEWSSGSRGSPLNGVLNATVSKVTLRTLCQHTWYNSGMTVSVHSSPGNPGDLSQISGELGTFHAGAGAFQLTTLSPSVWAPFKAAGRTLMAFRPPGGSTDLSYYGYFWGGGNNNANVPRLAVTYTQ